MASAGTTPLTGPLSLAQAEFAYDNHTGFFLPKKLPPKMHAAGRLLGLSDALSIETSGHLAGLLAAVDCGATVEAETKAAQERLNGLPGPTRGSKLVQAPASGRKSFMCFDEDTTIKNVEQALKMGVNIITWALMN